MDLNTRFYPGELTEAVTEREIRNRAISREAAAQGMVLLENDGILPLKAGMKLALFGRGARQTIKGGTGSGDVNSRDVVSVEQGLQNAGFEIVNTGDLDAFDAAWAESLAEWEKTVRAAAGPEKDPMKMYTAHSKTRPKEPENLPFDEAACRSADAGIFIISRTSGEGGDRRDTAGDYYLTEKEKSELERARRVCGKVVVVLNVGGIIDLGWMDEMMPAALVLMGQAGADSGNALADVLSGKVNFSGRLTDTWAARYEDYPSSAGFGPRRDEFREEFYTDGIYVGYRYFDAFGVKPRYPFGYGLSYTTFDMTFVSAAVEGSEGIVRVRVKNTGAVAGRQVAQLYVSCPAAEQQKELKRLAAFGKTRELAGGEEEELVLRFPLESLGSFRRQAWELEKGEYILLAGSSSADCVPAARLTLRESTVVRELAPVCELLDSLTEIQPEDTGRAALEKAAAGTPEIPMDAAVQALKKALAEEKKNRKDPLREAGWDIASRMSNEEKTALVVGRSHSREVIGAASASVPDAAGETTAYPGYGVPGMVLADGPAGLRLQKRYEINPEDGSIYGLSRFEMLEHRFFGTLRPHEGAESRYQFATAIPVGTLLAQSFDPALLEKAGEMIAEEMREFGVSVWLAPGMNIHRNPLCGRNFEYFSEDPLVSGIMAAAITRGVQKQGDLSVCIKHFACNNQEEDRFHVTAVISQRALREIYLKGFEIAIRTAQPMSIMTSYNRINSVHTANSHDLCTVLAREEWGFGGFIMTDWTTTNGGHGSSAAKCILAGNDLVMPGTESDRRDIAKALQGDHDRRLPEEKLTESAARLIGAALKTGRISVDCQ